MSRLRTAAAATVLAAGLAVPFAGSAFAQGQDRDCEDFETTQQATDALQPGDPERLDADGDGIACENLPDQDVVEDDDQVEEEAPAEEDDQVEEAPEGGVETGDGSGGDAAGYVLGGLALTGVAGGAALYARRLRQDG